MHVPHCTFSSEINPLLVSQYQEPGWFDEIANQPGILTARLATEVSSLETVTGAQLGTITESICLIVASLVIIFMYSWQLALVNICFLPLTVASSAIQVGEMPNGAPFSSTFLSALVLICFFCYLDEKFSSCVKYS